MSVNSQGGALAVSVGGNYFFTDPSKSMESFDRKRQRAEQATGNRFNTVDWYDADSEIKCNVTRNLADTDVTNLFSILGLGATIGTPTSTTLIYADENRTITVTNQLCNVVEISGERGKPWILSMDFLGTSAPTSGAGYGSRPSFASVGNYLYWRDLLTFVSAAASSTNCQKFSIKVEHNLDPFYGVRSDGFALPTVLTPTDVYVTGTFTMQMLTHADYDLFIAACDTPADITVTGKAFCAVSPPTMTLTCKTAIYDSVKPVRALKKVSMEDFSFVSKALNGANPAVINIA